jgi:glutathione S-transferase
MNSITLWQLQPSFNSRKVRYALGAKGVPYEAVNVGDTEVQQVIDVSGQPLTPVLRHGKVVLFDSGAIVRYIDANIPGPRLFSPRMDEMRAIEQWETRSRAEILAPYLKIGAEVKAGRLDSPEIREARDRFFAAAHKVQDSLNEQEVLVGTTLSAADIFCGCYLAYGFLTPAQAGKRPPMVWSLQNLNLAQDPSLARLTAWFERLRPLDPA